MFFVGGKSFGFFSGFWSLGLVGGGGIVFVERKWFSFDLFVLLV